MMPTYADLTITGATVTRPAPGSPKDPLAPTTRVRAITSLLRAETLSARCGRMTFDDSGGPVELAPGLSSEILLVVVRALAEAAPIALLVTSAQGTQQRVPLGEEAMVAGGGASAVHLAGAGEVEWLVVGQ
jgi:hypothetical protein